MSAEKTISQEYIYRGKILNMRRDEVELTSGRRSTREVCEHNGAVAVIPVTENGDVILVSQFRYPFGEVLREVPAGKLEPGEAHLECAVRELSEETGYTARSMRYLGVIYPSPGYLTERIHTYLAEGLVPGEMHPDDGEELTVERIPLRDALSICDEGGIRDAKTVALIYRAARILGID